MNMDDKLSKVWIWQDVLTHTEWKNYYETRVYISLKKDGADSTLYVTNLALTGLSTTAFVSLKNILKIRFIVMGTF